MEQVVQWNPEYIFMGRVNNVELITQDPAWSSIQAVKNGKVYVNLKGVGVADYSTDCFLLMEQIAKTLHPDLFKDLNMTEETKSYYSEFYNYKLTDEQANLILNFKTPEGK
jgi:iron complex transport system substrate-binding protein